MIAAVPRGSRASGRTRWLDVDTQRQRPVDYLPKVVAVTGLVWAVAAARQRLLGWGAPAHEADGWFPGADVVPGGQRIETMADGARPHGVEQRGAPACRAAGAAGG